jgi:heat shock transcription factor
MQPQGFAAPAQLSNNGQYQWNQGGENGSLGDANSYVNMNAFGTNNLSNPQQYNQDVSAPNTQLARRPMNRQLVSTAPRATYEGGNDPWGPFGDETILDPQHPNGIMEENDSVERLEERAVIAKREAQSKRKQIPPFVQKLSRYVNAVSCLGAFADKFYSFLDESKNTELIRWSDRGDSFVVLDEDEFAKTLIPELFKHNNYASFVRQLNMYGFHKRVGLSDNSMKASERKNKSPSEYYNPYFKRGHPNLLWLINKPKGSSGQKKGKSRQKTEEDGSEEDGQDGSDEIYTQPYGQIPGTATQRAISAAPESGQVQKREMALVQNQLQEIQKSQSAISNAIGRLRKDQNQIYQQAVAFQTLHDRHESSINAILTFLATIYNRSLDGQSGPNIAQMFANAMPQDQQQQGNVVDIGDLNNQQQQPQPGSLSPNRRAQRLLMAPPDQRSTTASPAGSMQSPMNSGQYQNLNSSRPGAIEELFENSPSESPQVKTELDAGPQQERMMNLINNTNAQSFRPGSKGMDFPDALSHFETTNGNSPLTSEQRQDMLQLIAQSTSGHGANNALISPSPPVQPSLEDLGYTQAEIEELARMQSEQENKINQVSNLLQPLSPSGSIPGLNDNQYFADATVPSPNAGSNLDIDQFLDTSAYGDYNYDGFNGGNIPDASNFDFGLDGTNDSRDDLEGGEGRIVEAGGSSEAATPENMDVKDETMIAGGQRSPSKRRRKA